MQNAESLSFPTVIESGGRGHKTVPIETNVSEFGATFFPQLDRPCFFQSLGEKNKKQKICHQETGGNDGRQRRWLITLPAELRTPF